MNKLNFQEENIDDPSTSEDERFEKSAKKSAKAANNRGFDLFDLSNAEDIDEAEHDMLIDEMAECSSTSSDETSGKRHKKANKKKKKTPMGSLHNPLTTAPTSVAAASSLAPSATEAPCPPVTFQEGHTSSLSSDPSKPTPTSLSISKVLQSFLAKKREYVIPEPEDFLEYQSDVYLQAFHLSHEEQEKIRLETENKDSKDTDRTDNASTEIDPTPAKNKQGNTENEEGDDDEVSELRVIKIDESWKVMEGLETDEDEGDGSGNILDPAPKPASDTITVQLFNLPYNTGKEEIKRHLRSSGIKFLSVLIGPLPNNKPPLLAGAGLLEVSAGTSINPLLTSLRALTLGGRVLRAQLLGGVAGTKNMGGGGQRYFEDNLGCKCNQCGCVGHFAVDCPNPPLPTPCHLCAGTDHDPFTCPHVICFRCGGLGHQSKDCRTGGGGWGKPIYCFYCASSYHESIHCKYFEAIKTYEKYLTGVSEGSKDGLLRCMVCYTLGCADHPSGGGLQRIYADISTEININQEEIEIFCPNCGEEGHSVDICRFAHKFEQCPRNLSYCLYPKFDAFARFPNLAKDMESFKGGDINELYRSLARGPLDTSLFPSLLSAPRNLQYAMDTQRYNSSGDSRRQSYPFTGRGAGGGGGGGGWSRGGGAGGRGGGYGGGGYGGGNHIRFQDQDGSSYGNGGDRRMSLPGEGAGGRKRGREEYEQTYSARSNEPLPSPAITKPQASDFSTSAPPSHPPRREFYPKFNPDKNNYRNNFNRKY